MKREFTTNIEFKNMDKLAELLKDAKYYLKEFNKAVEKINKTKIETNIDLKKG